jgi:hypothetical protein
MRSGTTMMTLSEPTSVQHSPMPTDILSPPPASGDVDSDTDSTYSSSDGELVIVDTEEPGVAAPAPAPAQLDGGDVDSDQSDMSDSDHEPAAAAAAAAAAVVAAGPDPLAASMGDGELVLRRPESVTPRLSTPDLVASASLPDAPVDTAVEELSHEPAPTGPTMMSRPSMPPPPPPSGRALVQPASVRFSLSPLAPPPSLPSSPLDAQAPEPVVPAPTPAATAAPFESADASALFDAIAEEQPPMRSLASRRSVLSMPGSPVVLPGSAQSLPGMVPHFSQGSLVAAGIPLPMSPASVVSGVKRIGSGDSSARGAPELHYDSDGEDSISGSEVVDHRE